MNHDSPHTSSPKPSDEQPADQAASTTNTPADAPPQAADDQSAAATTTDATSDDSSAADAAEPGTAHAKQPADRSPAASPPPGAPVHATQPPDTASSDTACSEAASSEATEPRRKFQIGSRRNRPTDEAPSAKPQVRVPDMPPETVEQVPAEQPAPPPPARGPVPTPSVRDPLPADLEEELAAAMGGASLDEMLSDPASSSPAAEIELELRLKSTVARIHGDNVFFSLGGRHEGVASLRQFPEPPALGAELEVIVKSYQADDGLYELVIPGASTQVDDWADVVEGTVVDARITGANTGGLECKVGNLRGFIPASQIAIFRVEDYAEFIDQKLLCVVTEVNPRRKNLVLSRRAILEREKEEARRQLLESLEVGQVYEGTVRKLMDFGAFVDIGGVDGLVHVSQLSWDRVNHPSDVLEVGQKIRVKIEKVDPQTGKISLSHRDLLDHPWLDINDKFPVETVVRGTVSRIAKFGAFVKLAPGVEGLVHISELSHARVPNVAAVVSEGQEVEVKVLSIDGDAQRIALSMKAVIPEPETAAGTAADDTQAEDALKVEREKVAAKRTKPLKGGIGRDSGGEQFGLKW